MRSSTFLAMGAMAIALVSMTGCGLMLDSSMTDAGGDAGDAAGGDGGDSGVPSDGGDAGDGAVCYDVDMDGVTDCAGDCDDTDSRTYPGAAEACGDMLRNDCTSGMPDEGCGGMGTFVAPPPLGDDANMGTRSSPMTTITEGMNKAMILGVPEVYVAADTPMAAPGVYREDIDMVEGISLVGGHESAGWTRDAAHITRIRVTRLEGLRFDATITRATRLEGFEVRSGASGSGTAATITVDVGASPTIVGNRIDGPDNTMGRSEAISINSVRGPALNSGIPLIEDNTINLGTTPGGWGNLAYGVSAGATQLELLDNRIFIKDNIHIQFAVNVYGAPGDTVIRGNVIRGRGRSELAWGMNVTPNRNVASNLLVDRNDIDPGECQRGCTGFVTGGQGPTAPGTPHSVTITNNVIFGGSGPTSIGLTFGYEAAAPPNVPKIVVHSNFIRGSGVTSSLVSSGASFGVLLGEHPSTQLDIGEFYNNIIYSGVGGVRFAFFENDPNMDPVLLHNNAFYVETSGSASSQSAAYGDEAYRDGGTGTITGLVSLRTDVEINALSDLGGASVGNIVDDCDVASPMVSGDFHLMTGSACIDTGAGTLAPSADFEGDARPAGGSHDIGPDET